MRARRPEEIISSCAPSTSTSPRKKSGGNGASKSKNHSNGIRMEMYDHFYKKFIRPPMAPVYYPTAAEFADPIEYVAKIRPDAEKYGVVKIVPPKEFKPPFAINKETFTFKPRTQKLNEVEAIVKEKHTFIERLINFNRFSGLQFEFPLDRDGEIVDLYRLHRIVQNFGGCEEVNDEEKWRDVAREYLPKEQMARGVPSAFINLIRSHYNNHIEPFNRNLRDKEKKMDDESDEEEERKHMYQHNHGTMRSEPEIPDEKETKDEEEECPMSMQSGRRKSKNKKSAVTKRNSGGTSSLKNNRGKRIVKTEDDEEEEDDSVDEIICVTCKKGEEEQYLILCDIEGCPNGLHTYCCDPALDEVPTGEWRCPKCIESEDAKIGCDWGFSETDTEYNLNSFTEFANKWKCDYFNVNDVSEVSCETVEREFWKNVISHENPVSVKYGADLITSKVGSGFPRKEDKHTGPDSQLKQEYASHAWNLNNMPVLRESVLSYFNTGISGMMVPWVYVGMCFSTFCWHTEDHWTYSVNYNHFGERKIWYGVAGDDAEKFEDALKKLAPGLTGRQKDLFHHMTTAANPSLLRSMGVPIYAVHQNAGEFVITFPRAYHAGYNEGLNFAEAVNFAPIDWLSKGRECVESYSSVGRFLVFSHDELLFKMVAAMDKLGLSTILAACDELRKVIEKQNKLRNLITRLGVAPRQMEQVTFENIPDEKRSCKFCKTTIFMSALVCNKHNKRTCVEHHDHLCKACTPKDYKYQFRYEMDYLNHLLSELEKRTVNYTGWKEESEEMLEKTGKPELESIEECIDVAKQNKYPQTDQVHKLTTISHTVKTAIEKTSQLLHKKVRTRTKTRCQRADTRMDIVDVKLLIEQMVSMDCNLSSYTGQLEQLLQRIDAWRKKAEEVMDREQEYTKEDLERVVEEGEEFDIKLTEIEELRKLVEMKEWSERARKVTSWTPTSNMENEFDFECKKRLIRENILSLIQEGGRNPSRQVNDLLLKLQQMLSQASAREEEAQEFFKNPSLSLLQTVWNSLRNSDWLSEQYLNSVRFEVAQVAKIKSMIDFAVPSLSGFEVKDQLQRLPESEIILSQAIDINKNCEISKTLRHSREHSPLCDMVNKMLSFTERLTKLFKPINAYHNLYEILSERDDLTPLTEGQMMQLYYQGGVVHLADEWRQIKEFESSEQLLEHQSSLHEIQFRIFEKLRRTNSASGLQSCCCLGANTSEAPDSVLTCIMCDSQYHVQCCEWSPFLQNLPQGCYLCVRCLRGKRPVIADVSAALNEIPSNFLETNLVHNLIQKSRLITQSLMYGANKRQLGDPEGEELCKKALFDWLSCEILNLNGLPIAVELISEFYAAHLKKNASATFELQQRPVRAKPITLLFDSKTVSKRKRPHNTHKECSKKARKRHCPMSPNEYVEEEGEAKKSCQAQKCYKPYEGHGARWILCEAGCKNWYHFVCADLTLAVIQQMEKNAYRCISCLDNADSPSSSVSTK